MTMVSGNSRLLTCDEFRVIRDEIALKRMLERGEKLWNESEAALLEARALRKRLKSQYTPKQERHEIEEQYTKLILAWADMDAELGDIQRDQRYIEWKAKQPVAETA